MIVVSITATATNTDLLSGSALANIPADGQLDVYIAATQNDHTLSITGPGNEPILQAGKVQLRTNGMPSLKDDLPYSLPVTQGGKYILNYTVVTAGTYNLLAIWRSLDELGA